MNNKRKRSLSLIAALTLFFTLHISFNRKHHYPNFDNRFVVEDGRIKFSNGTIFIGDKEYLESVESGPNDILVLDSRDGNDPNLKIIDSYRIINNATKREVIEALLYYEELNPTDWDRTERSLFNEWVAHNILYNIDYKTHRSKDVDFNNADEETYKLSLIKTRQ